MRIISGEYDVTKVLASEMLNMEINRYLFYKGQVINWSHSAMSDLRIAMLAASKNLDTDMFIKYSLPPTVDNIETQYNIAPLYPIYVDRANDSTGAELGVFTKRYFDTNPRKYDVNVPLTCNLYKLIRGVIDELRVFPAFKVMTFDSERGIIEDSHVHNTTALANEDELLSNAYRSISIYNSKIFKSYNRIVDEEKHNIAADIKTNQCIKARCYKVKWRFNNIITNSIDGYSKYSDMHYDIYIDYLNLYKGARFSQNIALINGFIVYNWNIDFLIPSIYNGRYIDILELLDNDDTKHGMVINNHKRYNRCNRTHERVYVTGHNPDIKIGIYDIDNDQCMCLACFRGVYQKTSDYNSANFRLYYEIVFTEFMDEVISIIASCINSNKSMYRMIAFTILANLLCEDIDVEYSKKHGTIIQIKNIVNDIVDNFIIINDMRDVASIDTLNENARLIYVINDYKDGSYNDGEFDCNFQKI